MSLKSILIEYLHVYVKKQRERENYRKSCSKSRWL